MGSSKIPNKVLKLINEHNLSNAINKIPQKNYPEFYKKSQDFYDNLMFSLQKNKNMLSNCCKVSTNYQIPRIKNKIKPNQSKNPTQTSTERFFETIDKNEILFSNKDEIDEKNLLTLENNNKLLSSKILKKPKIFYDNLQKIHITRIRSAKCLKGNKNEKIAKTNEIIEFLKPPKMTGTSFQSLMSSSKLRVFPLNEKFPNWALERNDFQKKLQCPEFNLNSKILKICEKQY